jgi:hypothetical protein
MLGNTQGWFVSAIVALAGGWLLWAGSQPPKVSAPSGAFPNLLAKIALPTDPKTVSPAPMNEDCDAGEKYRAAIGDYLANRRQYEKWHKDAKSALSDKPLGVELVADAAACGGGLIFAPSPAEVLNYDPDPAPMEAVEQLGAMAVQRGILHLRAQEPEDARRYLAGAFALGNHLYGERVTWREFNTGINLMTDASRYLAQLETDAGRPEQARAILEFAAAADKYKLEQHKLLGAINTLDQATIARHGGDVFLLARQSPEPMWRGAAILALGRMKYNTPNRGDQLAARREIGGWITDSDPITRAAANAANRLTIEQYRTLR